MFLTKLHTWWYIQDKMYSDNIDNCVTQKFSFSSMILTLNPEVKIWTRSCFKVLIKTPAASHSKGIKGQLLTHFPLYLQMNARTGFRISFDQLLSFCILCDCLFVLITNILKSNHNLWFMKNLSHSLVMPQYTQSMLSNLRKT